jgi:hypothetical protein
VTANPFWIDWDYDRERASNGRPRYAHYVLKAGPEFDGIDADDPSVQFAAIAWRYANDPIMHPGLVRHHPRVADASVLRSDWNGHMICSVRLVAPRPGQLASVRPPQYSWYRDLPLDSFAGQYNGVGGRDLESGAYLTTEVQVLWQVPPGALPAIAEVPPLGASRYRHAVNCVEAIVAQLNQQIRPVIEAMESDTSDTPDAERRPPPQVPVRVNVNN